MGLDTVELLWTVEVESTRLAGKIEVMSLKKADGRWLILLNDDVVWNFPLVGRR